MAKKDNKNRAKQTKASKTQTLSLIFSSKDYYKQTKILNEVFQRTKTDNFKNIEIVFSSKYENIDFAPELKDKLPEKYALHTPNQNFEIESDYAVFVDLDKLKKPFNFGEIQSLSSKLSENANKLIFVGAGKIEKNKSHIWALEKDFAQYILNYQVDFSNIDYLIKKEKIEVEEFKIAQASPFEMEKSFGKKISSSFKNLINWFLILPILEMKKGKNERENFINNREPAIYRLLFFVLTFAMLFAMPILSLDVGISGDELVNYEHAKIVHEYYTKGNKAAVDVRVNPQLESTLMQYYGQSFDNFTYLVNKTIGTNSPYESRHIMNSLMGWLIILVTGLLLTHISGWRTAVFAVLMLFISPRFLGHSYNNPKDIPFAFAFVFSIYQMILWAKELPKIRIKRLIYIVLGIAFAISIRVGGLMLVGFLFLIIGLWFISSTPLKDIFKSNNFAFGFRLVLIMIGITIAAFFVGIIYWPYAIESPIQHAKESLDIMTNFSVGIRQLFEGENIWSDRAPWYYLPKYIFMTIPIVVILGLVAFVSAIKKISQKTGPLYTFIIVFAFIFPVWYIIYQKSNVYGGWRHVLFIYPFLVAAAAMGFDAIVEFFKNTWIRIATISVMAIFMISPLRHIAKNHPHEYIYYNELSGGIAKNYGYFEMDYYFHSVRTACYWLNDHIKKEHAHDKEKVIVVSNNMGITQYYFRNDTANVHVGYIRYYDRGTVDWDYCIVANSYIDAYQLQNDLWPPKNTIHTIDVDGKPVGAVIKRENKDDYWGYMAKLEADQIAENNEEKAEKIFTAIEHFKTALSFDPDNETALLYLTEIYMNMGQLDTAISYVDQLLTVHPSYENGLNYKGWLSMQIFDKTQNQERLNDAKTAFETLIHVNYKYVYAYYGLSMAYIRMNQYDNALSVAEEGLSVNPYFPALAELRNNLRSAR